MADRYDGHYLYLDAYHHRTHPGLCFICKIVARDPAFPTHHVIYNFGIIDQR